MSVGAIGLAAIACCGPLHAADATAPGALRIDIPIELKAAKVVFNMDHMAFEGDQPTGMNFMRIMAQKFKADRTSFDLIAVFHGEAGYMLLNDAAYDRVRRTSTGNLYKGTIAALQAEGVAFEECGQTARANGWGNADFLPGVKVNAGANFRIVQLVQDGFVQLQP
jgi:intracellular sulfur oxidation DsrE/DsrF family protein